MTTALPSATDASVRFLEDLFPGAALEQVAIRLWDGTTWPDERPRSATIVLRHPGALRAMFAHRSERGLAEAYLRDDFDIVGDIEAAFELADALGNRHTPRWREALASLLKLHALPAPRGRSGGRAFTDEDGPRHSVDRDRRAVTFHYDVSNDFFGLWLDRSMVYSCAYFEAPEDDLDTAQASKLDLLCRKLRLEPGQRVLDIGCGWGGFAIHAAREWGVTVTGVTLSQPQADFAAARARAAGLGDRAVFEVRDYRSLPESDIYDAIVSVGMSEHVGAERLPDYFRAAAGHLKPGGVFLNHAIGEGVRPRHRFGASFVDAYVFPDGEIPPVPTVLGAAEEAGLEVRDVENLRDHYAITLRHWIRRLEASHDAALAHVDESTYRVWRLYMAGSAHGFARGHLAVYQVLLSKPDAAGDARLPLTRRDWYA